MDMSKVDPVYRDQAQKRIAVIRSYLESEGEVADLTRTAKKLNLSTSQTRRLVKSWEIHRDPARITSGGRSGPRKPSSKRHKLIRAAAMRALASFDSAANTKKILESVNRECVLAGYDGPSSQQIHNIVMNARRSNRAPAINTDKACVVGRIWLQLPVRLQAGEATRRPEAIIAMALPSKMIAMVTSLEVGRPPKPSDLHEKIHGQRDWAELLGPLGISKGAGTLLARHLGGGIGDIDILFRKPRTDASGLSYEGSNQLSPEFAQKRIEQAVAYHQEQLIEALEG